MGSVIAGLILVIGFLMARIAWVKVKYAKKSR